MDVGSIDGTNQYLAISLPTKTIPASEYIPEIEAHAGGVILVDIASIDAGAQTVSSLAPYTVFSGDEALGYFGYDLGFTPADKSGVQNLFISQPHKNLGLGRDGGRLLLWKGGPNFPHGTVLNIRGSSSSCFDADVEQGLFGRSAQFLDFNNDGLIDVLIGSPRNNVYGKNSGKSYLIFSVFS